MTDTTQATASAPAASNAINTFFSNLKTELQVVEEDVIAVIQNLGVGIEVAAEDIQWCLSWLGGHIGDIATTVTAVTNTVSALNTAGVSIPSALTNGIAQINQAVAGVDAALNNQTLSSDSSSALVSGYQATKALEVAAASAAAIAATVQAATSPTTSTSTGS